MNKKDLLALMAVLFLTVEVWAAKAMPTPFVFTQPDGSTLTVIMHGDEYGSWFTTTDGVFLTRKENSFYICELSDGNLTATQYLAHNEGQRTPEEITAITYQDKNTIEKLLNKERNTTYQRNISIADTNPRYVSHTGSPKILVILAEYNDRPFTVKNPELSFEQYFNAEGENNHTDYGNSEKRNYYSVREYFNTVSRGAYTPEFCIVGPVSVQGMDVYGGVNENSPNDENTTQLVIDAISALPESVNISDFDNDGDGAIDMVYIIYSGYGQNSGGDGNTVWAKTSLFNRTIGDTKVTWYSCSSELNLYEEFYAQNQSEPYINGIGVTCHEFSHALGLPDTYPTNSAAYTDNQEMEFWDLMDAGEYVSNGYRPRDYTAWEREVMGWMEIETLNDNKENIEIKPLLDGGPAYKFVNPANTDEYFILENVQKSGLNRSMYGHGLIVYHVKYPAEAVSMGKCPNNTKGFPGMAIVPADGICLSSYISSNMSDYRTSHEGDPFPGTSGMYQLNYKLELPNFKWYEGEDTKVANAIYDIMENEDNGIVTFSYTTDYDAYLEAESAITNTRMTETNTKTFDIQGREISNGLKGVFIKNGRRILR